MLIINYEQIGQLSQTQKMINWQVQSQKVFFIYLVCVRKVAKKFEFEQWMESQN